MKGKRGRPMIPMSNISNKKADGLTGSPSDTPSGEGNAHLACGGTAKKRLDKKARGGSIHIKPSHKGLLHKDTHTKAGEKIPESKIKKAEKSSNPAVRKRAVFAENAKHWSKKADGGGVPPNIGTSEPDGGPTEKDKPIKIK